jgi:hypothetical protein
MNCFNCTTPCELSNPFGFCIKDETFEGLADVVRKNSEPPVSREKFERRKKVWRAHEKAVLEPFLSAAQDLVDAVERYVEPKPGQEFVHRSEILLKKNALKKLL